MQSALEVARAAGVEVNMRGSRGWACCPMHGERTASLCFYPDGRFYCFGCQAHGDAADLYAALNGCSLGEALRAVGKELSHAPRPRGNDLRRKVERWREEQRSALCKAMHEAADIIERAEDSPALWDAIERRSRAEDQLNAIDAMQPADLVAAMAQEGRANAEYRMGSAG